MNKGVVKTVCVRLCVSVSVQYLF